MNESMEMKGALIQEAGAEGQETLYEERPLPIGQEQLQRAWNTLLKYRADKARLEKRIVDNQQWYRLRQWESMREGERQQVEPVSAWLFNSIANKHADAMDNLPAASILPREKNDESEAKMLSAVVPVLLDSCEFERVYSLVMDDKLISGTGVYGVFWNGEKLNGLGDVDIVQADVINLFWENGVSDIQHSPNLFYVTLKNREEIEQEYPKLEGKLTGGSMELGRYLYDDSVDNSDKCLVVDWYYKKRQGGRRVLHYCKFIPGQPEALYATENDNEAIFDGDGNMIREALSERGWYEHGLYPFIFDPLFRCKGSPCGFGYVDVGKNAQEYIDRGDQAIMQNLLFNCKPRHFIRNDGSVNEEEYADLRCDFVHVDGALGQDSILPVRGSSLDGIYLTVINNKIDELKETTGNRDVSSGGTSGGATAASAIAAMQEAGSKLSRDSCRAAYHAFKKLVLMVIELIRQFYDLPRCFRIMGENGQQDFISYSNSGLLPQRQSIAGLLPDGAELEMGCRLPLFDVAVTAVKASPYSRMGQNELALQFYSAGFFEPERAEAALACLDMMDFDRKDFVVAKIAKNAAMTRELAEVKKLASAMAMRLGDEELAERLGAMDESRKAVPHRVRGVLGKVEKARRTAADAASPT